MLVKMGDFLPQIFGMKIPKNIWVTTTQITIPHGLHMVITNSDSWPWGMREVSLNRTGRLYPNPEKGVKKRGTSVFGVQVLGARALKLRNLPWEKTTTRKRLLQGVVSVGQTTQETTQLMNVRNPTFGKGKKNGLERIPKEISSSFLLKGFWTWWCFWGRKK